MENTCAKALIDKIKSKSAVIGVIGLGYVGLPLSLRFAHVGFQVIGFDVDAEKADKINSGTSYIEHISTKSVGKAVADGLFSATTDFSRAKDADALIICVPTPLSKYRDPDLSYVIGTIDNLTPHLRKGQVVSLESTTYPGTTEEILCPKIESRGLKVGKDIFLVYSPEREDPGNKDFSTSTIPKICGGHTQACLEVGLALYSQVIDKVVPVSSTKAAELTKLLENIYRAVNIGLVNELKTIADPMGIDILEVINAAATKPFGFTPFYPGPGLGGHCIPIDPFYLTWKAREYGVHTRFIELAGEINTAMPFWVVNKLVESLNNQGKPLKGAKVLILGIAYKKNVDDTRESPAVEILDILHRKGAIMSYSDPHMPVFPKMRAYNFDMASTAITAESISMFDAVLIATNHDKFDYQLILENAKLIIDTRGVYSSKEANVVKA